MKAINLFGELQEITEKKAMSPYQIIKCRNKYGPSKNSVERCKNCSHCIGMRGNTKTFYKCKLIGVSNSEATDIRLKDTCNKFEHEI